MRGVSHDLYLGIPLAAPGVLAVPYLYTTVTLPNDDRVPGLAI